MKRLLVTAAAAAALGIPASASAFHHVAVPADECAPAQAGTPGDNPTAHAAIADHNPAQTLPLPPFGTPGDAATPEACPAPGR
ncbi:MAG TPA: hypothetical protein VFB42_04645 [Gaiellaceae bacterium]|nr:hypothetical protein [Gaiellaceae bacterium]